MSRGRVGFGVGEGESERGEGKPSVTWGEIVMMPGTGEALRLSVLCELVLR